MRLANVLIVGSFVLATVLGIYGQDLSYYMDRTIVEISPIYYLTGLTGLSIFLYLAALSLTFLFYKKQKIQKDKFGIYLAVICMIGTATSLWSTFVTAMWWG
ncbi:hypothetical protein [Peribacillus phoenicis]|uniref:hypothetical protein n=1 Tax=unclassified Peribacillus TaxID=2675266 RepID=UPI0039A3D0D1